MDKTDKIPDLIPATDFVLVEGGRFDMGDGVGDLWEACRPVHQVEVPSFYICRYQVTQAQWQKVMDNNPSESKGERKPVKNVSWLKCKAFIKKLNQLTANAYRLPTEAEWEFAARGGVKSEGYLYAGSDKLKQVGWNNDNAKGERHEVGQLLANELGLHDMSGNVYEWCEDDWHQNYNGAPADGTAWVDLLERDSGRVLRGGSYFDEAENCRPTARGSRTPDRRSDNVGFRLVLPLQSVG